jgi:hypothetical protein
MRTAASVPNIANVATPVSLAFGMISALGSSVGYILQVQERRLRQLEERN